MRKTLLAMSLAGSAILPHRASAEALTLILRREIMPIVLGERLVKQKTRPEVPPADQNEVPFADRNIAPISVVPTEIIPKISRKVRVIYPPPTTP